MLGPALDVVASMIPRIEAERRLPREVVDAFVAAGIFKLVVPRAYGGADASVREAIEVRHLDPVIAVVIRREAC